MTRATREKSINPIFQTLTGYHILDIFFFVFHTGLTLFNCLGWIWKTTRRWNLFTLALTAGSWFILGIWFGWGYCVCTDWHWSVREQLGYFDQSHSYIHFLILKLTGANLDEGMVEKWTLIIFLFAVLMSVLLNILDFRRYRFARSGRK